MTRFRSCGDGTIHRAIEKVLATSSNGRGSDYQGDGTGKVGRVGEAISLQLPRP